MKVLIGANNMGLEASMSDLEKRFPQLDFQYCADREETAAMIADADIYMGWLNREIFLAAKDLKWIQSPSSGVNYFTAIPELVERDVLLTSASGTHATCVAESAMAMILSVTRGVRTSIIEQQKHKWAISQIRPTMVELTGSTMGIIGFGAIGRALAKRAHAFDMRVLAVDLYPADMPEHVDEMWGLDRLDDLLREADYVVVLVPFTSQTEGMIGAAQLGLMKSSAMLVGMSRGGIIDQEALVKALGDGSLAGAALDVFKPEPLPEDSELWDIDNLLMTPHIAGGTQYEAKYVLEIFYENLERYLNQDFPLRNQVNKQAGF